MMRIIRFVVTAVLVLFGALIVMSLIGSFATVTSSEQFGGLRNLTYFFAGWVGGIYAGGMVLIQVMAAIIAIVVCALARVDSRYGIMIVLLAALGSGFSVLMTPLGYLLFALEILAVLTFGIVSVLAKNGYGYNRGRIYVEGDHGKMEATQERFAPDSRLDALTSVADQLAEITEHLTLPAEEDHPAYLPEDNTVYLEE